MKSLSLNRPHALIMVGIPGSGKTTFAKQFSETFSAPHIEASALATYARDDASSRDLMMHVLAEFMKTGQSLVIDAYADSRRVRTELAKYCRDHGYSPLFIWVQTDPETARQRATRSMRLSKEQYDKELQSFSAPHASEKPLVISGKHTYASQAKVVLRRLSLPRAEISKHSQAPVRPGQIRVQ